MTAQRSTLAAGRRWDVRDATGMRTTFGRMLAVVFCAVQLAQALNSTDGIRHVWIIVVAWVLLSGAVAGVMLLPGDPLPLQSAIALAFTAPIASVLVLSQLPVPVAHAGQLWFHPFLVAYLVFMCVRGAVGCAWAGMLIQTLTVIAWASMTGQGVVVGFALTAMNLVPLLMATFFAYKVRPVARAIVVLCDEANQRAAQQAAALAASDERDRGLAEVDRLVRPIMERIASGAELTLEEQAECLLLDAQLRDRIRGSALVDERVIELARAARQRGVTVTLLDDGGAEAQPEHYIQTVRAQLCAALERARSGSITARVHPPGREVLATVLVQDTEGERLIEVDPQGRVGASEGVVEPAEAGA
ncbi:hypothetical protein [Hoyosella subflava]|uniref:Uncharacterized protein n=1 Tax=Hoyosella subflava (strain DSM 45089 / JCM 17490 / NBRC 109087 / DQS3-9A1) TaxID=443218 RepID=F6EJ68_HOYSD|nr:hypothetical protein [Hoyosella subflava]AEF41300.1 hypothetical protein AS9A_2853 [Hoyosella subflava DQS3-9A1]